jgi:hypothetical protein
LIGASHKIKIAKLRENGHSSHSAIWDAPTPRIEARALFQLIGQGATPEAIRDLIAIPPETEQLLRAYASQHPEERPSIERTISFRTLVSQEFERLYKASSPEDVRALLS